MHLCALLAKPDLLISFRIWEADTFWRRAGLLEATDPLDAFSSTSNCANFPDLLAKPDLLISFRIWEAAFFLPAGWAAAGSPVP